MAKKKKKPGTHHRHHRRGRVGAIGKFNLMDTLQGGLGLVLGATAGTMVQKYVHAVPQKILGAGQLVLGMLGTQQHNKILSAAGWGFAGAGATALAHDTGILRGIDDMISGMGGGSQEIEYRGQTNGLPNEYMVGGLNNEATLSQAGGEEPMGTSFNQRPAYYPMAMGW